MFGVAGLRINMLAPDGSGHLRNRATRLSYGVWVLCWLVGHIAGGALLGAALGWLGRFLHDWRTTGLWVAAALCLAYGLHHLGLVKLPLPHWPRQVPRGWMLRHPWNLVALGYGMQLGCAVATRITVATVYPVLVLAVMSGSPVQGAALLSVFGLARSILPVLAGPWVDSPQKSLRLALRLDLQQAWVWKLNGAALLAGFLVIASAAYGTWR